MKKIEFTPRNERRERERYLRIRSLVIEFIIVLVFVSAIVLVKIIAIAKVVVIVIVTSM
jgi:hypothetical protein